MVIRDSFLQCSSKVERASMFRVWNNMEFESFNT